MDDLVGSHSRKVVIPVVNPDGSKSGKLHTYDLDVDADPFWAHNRRLLFPAAIEAHDVELRSVMEKEAAIRRTAGPGADPTAELDAADVLGAKGLAEAVDSLPALLKQRKLLDMHTNIMQVATSVCQRDCDGLIGYPVCLLVVVMC